MIVYHGSYIEVENPSVDFSKRNLDFGRGFYLTTYPDQAERWAKRKALRTAGQAKISVYELGEDLADYHRKSLIKIQRNGSSSSVRAGVEETYTKNTTSS
jgi:predicted RNA-binding protein YlxR (DUF448 family)